MILKSVIILYPLLIWIWQIPPFASRKCCVSFHFNPRVCFTVLEWADRNHTADIKWCFTHSHWWKWTEQSSEEHTSHKLDLIDKTRQSWHFCLVHQDPASSTTSEADSDTRENEPATLNYKPSPLHMKIGLSILPDANAVFCITVWHDEIINVSRIICSLYRQTERAG